MTTQKLVWIDVRKDNKGPIHMVAKGVGGIIFSITPDKEDPYDKVLKVEYGNACPLQDKAFDLQYLYQCAQFFNDTILSIQQTGHCLESTIV